LALFLDVRIHEALVIGHCKESWDNANMTGYKSHMPQDWITSELLTYNKKIVYSQPDCSPHEPKNTAICINFRILTKIPVLVNPTITP
jgi:hypothetical protein